MKSFAVLPLCWLSVGVGCTSVMKTEAVDRSGAREGFRNESGGRERVGSDEGKTLQVNPRFNGLASGEDLVRREGEFRQVVAGMTRAQAVAQLGAPLVSDAKHARWSAADPATGMTVVLDLMLDAGGVFRYAAVTKPVSSLAGAASTSNSGPVLRADLDQRFDGMGWSGKSPAEKTPFTEQRAVPFPELLSNSQ